MTTTTRLGIASPDLNGHTAMSKRAERRHHYERRKRKASRIFASWWRGNDMDCEANRGRYANTPKPCSCTACGNPRKYFKQRTVQERRETQE